MSERGTITEWDAARAWGTIRLDRGGPELRFNENACAEGMTCNVGTVVFVFEHVPYIGGQRRATSISPTEVPALTSFERVELRSELDRELTARLIRDVGRSFDPAPFEHVPHIDHVLAQFGIQIATTILDDGEEPLGIAYQPKGLVAWTPFDPCFVAFGGIDGDAWGVLCHPWLLARGEAPIVKWDHEGEPIAFEAATFAHWLAKRATSATRKAWLASRGFLAPGRTSTQPLAESVRAIVAGNFPAETEERLALDAYVWCDPSDRLARLDALIAIYRKLRWPAMLIERAEVQRAVVVAQAAHDAEVDRITREHHAAHPDVYR